ncbi:hypothetical protein vseg_015981 [Gypsophila vaccaria]
MFKMNPSKSTAYFRGISDDIKRDILQISGFSEGCLPFNYLGMPIQTTRLKGKDCDQLVENLCNRIHSYGARKFSYAGRLVIIKAILSTLHRYWASLFVLPKAVTGKIEAICRNFLWDNSAEFRRVPLVAWNKDSLWVHWVKATYLKEQDWLSYTPTNNSSWVWRKTCAVKNLLQQEYADGFWMADTKGYSPAGGYHWLLGREQDVPWTAIIWNNWILPKHQVIGWLFAHGALKTADKLSSYGMQIDTGCSSMVLQEICRTTNITVPTLSVMDWCLNVHGTETQRGVIYALVIGAIYHIWKQRNQCRNEKRLHRPKDIVTLIIRELCTRVSSKPSTTWSSCDKNWLTQLKLK